MSNSNEEVADVDLLFDFDAFHSLPALDSFLGIKTTMDEGWFADVIDDDMEPTAEHLEQLSPQKSEYMSKDDFDFVLDDKILESSLGQTNDAKLNEEMTITAFPNEMTDSTSFRSSSGISDFTGIQPPAPRQILDRSLEGSLVDFAEIDALTLPERNDREYRQTGITEWSGADGRLGSKNLDISGPALNYEPDTDDAKIEQLLSSLGKVDIATEDFGNKYGIHFRNYLKPMKEAIAATIGLQKLTVQTERQLGCLRSTMHRIRELLKKDRGIFYTNDFWTLFPFPAEPVNAPVSAFASLI